MPRHPPVSSSSWKTTWPKLVLSGQLPGPEPEITRPFWLLYDAVTDMIREKSCYWDKEQSLFVEYLIAGFFQYYQQWRERPELLSYLSMFHQRSAFRSLQLIGQAYLHMAYDLPRAVANGFAEFPQLDRSLATLNYLSLEGGFENVAQQSFRRYSIVGIFAILGVSASSRRTAAGNFCFWMKNIRSNAFLHASVLAKPPHGNTRNQIEQRLIEEIKLAARMVLDRSWNPLCWLPALSSPSIMAVFLPMAILVQLELLTKPIWLSITSAIVLLITLLVVLLIVRFILSRALVRMTEALGSAISRATWKVVGSLAPLEKN